jgi:hypothetical protein
VLRHGGAAKKQTVVEGVLEVAEDMLRSHEMGLLRVVHVEAHLLDRVGDVGFGEGEVLESSSQAAVGNRVTDVGARVGGDLGLSVDRRGVELAVAHASTLKDILSELVLVEEEVVNSLLYRDAEEMMEGAEVLHGKLLVESRSGMLEKPQTRGGEDDVVDVEEQVGDVSAVTVDEQRGVRLDLLHEAKGHQVGGKAVIPSSRSLLQIVERLIEPAH